jgi:hypothetical protein
MSKAESGIKRVANTASNLATIGATAYKAYKVATMVAGLINVEKKFYDTALTVTSTAFNSSGSVGVYTTMAQGSDYNQRNGNSIKPSSFMSNIIIRNTSTSVTSGRMIIFRDMENRQANAAVTDVLETATTESPLNHLNGHRFKILKDLHFTLDQYHPVKYVKYFHKFKKAHIRYVGTGSGVANADEGNIFILFISDQGTGGAPSASLYTRLRFIDN